MRQGLYNFLENIGSRFFGPLLKNYGRKLYVVGTYVQGVNASEDRLVPSLRRVTHNGKTPQLQEADFVAPNATVLGDVVVQNNSSIWYGATVLGVLPIRIGSNSIIQDRAHLSRKVTIGDYVYIGPNAILQGSNINNRAFVGMGATVRHATVQKQAIVAAGAVVSDNLVIPSGQVWAGNPAQYIRDVSPVQKQILREYLQQTQSLAKIHEEETSKSFRQLLSQKGYDPEEIADFIEREVQQMELPEDEGDEEYIEQRIFMKEKLTYQDPDLKDYDPYEYEMSRFPDEFQVGAHKDQVQKVKANLRKVEKSDLSPWRDAF